MIEQILQADRYLQVDQVEKAREVYQKVVDMDPGNAIAVVGLARCALADGDDEQAYELASRALEIDPENDMARRMEARLSEIMATRGQPVERPPAASTPSSIEMRTVVTDGPAARAAYTTGSAPTPAAERSAAATSGAISAEPSAGARSGATAAGAGAAAVADPAAPESAATPASAKPPAREPAAAPTSAKPATPSATKPAAPRASNPSKPKEPAVRKSLFDRLLGR